MGTWIEPHRTPILCRHGPTVGIGIARSRVATREAATSRPAQGPHASMANSEAPIAVATAKRRSARFFRAPLPRSMIQPALEHASAVGSDRRAVRSQLLDEFGK